MEQHTPGPWTIADCEVASEWGFTDQDLIHPIKAEGYGVIGWVDGTPIDDEQQRANAAFIVRACNAHDDLLAALKEVLRCYCEPSGPHCGNIVTGEMRESAVPAARAAIAKAEGQS